MTATRRRLVFCIAAGMAALTFLPSQGRAEDRFSAADYDTMSFAFGRHSSTPGCGRTCVDFVVARGKIGLLSYFQLLLALRQAAPAKVPVVLHSPGGMIDGGREMARILRMEGHDVIIARATPVRCSENCTAEDRAAAVQPYRLEAVNAECSSACAMLIAGARRILIPEGARIGVHQPSIDQIKQLGAVRDETEALAIQLSLNDMRAFYGSMGISSGIMDIIQATAKDDMRYLSTPELERLGFRTVSLRNPPRSRDAWPPPSGSGGATEVQRP
jgi:hypothetical protein